MESLTSSQSGEHRWRSEPRLAGRLSRGQTASGCVGGSPAWWSSPSQTPGPHPGGSSTRRHQRTAAFPFPLSAKNDINKWKVSITTANHKMSKYCSIPFSNVNEKKTSWQHCFSKSNILYFHCQKQMTRQGLFLKLFIKYHTAASGNKIKNNNNWLVNVLLSKSFIIHPLSITNNKWVLLKQIISHI